MLGKEATISTRPQLLDMRSIYFSDVLILAECTNKTMTAYLRKSSLLLIKI